MLQATTLSVTVKERTLVQALDFAVGAGECVCVLGRNGVGKTLTLHTLAGLRAPAHGRVLLENQSLETLTRRQIARRLGVLLQIYDEPFSAGVLETALIGRHPHIGFWQWESAEDHAITRMALESVDLAELENRRVDTLSGGERRRLAIATVLAQTPEMFLLDEPLNHLDPHHQLQIMRLFREKTRQGKSVVMSLHDVNLAARFCDRALLLFGDGRWLYDSCDKAMTEENLTELFHTPWNAVTLPDRTLFVAA